MLPGAEVAMVSKRTLAVGTGIVILAAWLGAATPRAGAQAPERLGKVDHKTRALAYEKAMEALAQKYPSDREAAIFYALALNVTLNPNDKTYANQLKAAGILEKVFAEQPEHPGVAHYLIHSYDFPPIAQKGLPAARR